MQISYNQETYTLTQEAYLDGIGNDLYYTAIAIDSHGKEFKVYWEVFQQAMDAWEEMKEYAEENAADWNNPSAVLPL